MDVIAKLNELAELQAAADVTRLDFEAKRTEILAKVKDELDALDVEFAPLLSTVNERVTGLESEIKAFVASLGESVKGSRLHAVYSKPRVSWDTKKLDGYAAGHPEILAFRKEGEPSVSIRAVK
jgi:hypothetical protein